MIGSGLPPSIHAHGSQTWRALSEPRKHAQSVKLSRSQEENCVPLPTGSPQMRQGGREPPRRAGTAAHPGCSGEPAHACRMRAGVSSGTYSINSSQAGSVQPKSRLRPPASARPRPARPSSGRPGTRAPTCPGRTGQPRAMATSCSHRGRTDERMRRMDWPSFSVLASNVAPAPA